MASGSGQGRRDDDLHSERPAFSEEGMRRIVYGEDRETMRDSRSAAFAQDTEELEADLRGRRSLVPAVTALAAIFCFGAIVWYAYTWGTGKMASEDLPVVVAEPMPEKVKPAQPGGMEVPHQGIAVLNQGETGAGEGRVEQLLPPPETPAPPETMAPAAPQTALQGGEETLPPAPGEAPLVAEVSPDMPTPEAPADSLAATAAPETPGTPDTPDTTEPAEAVIAKPIPKPQTDDGSEDQIAALLEQAPLETADGEPSDAPLPSPPAAPAATQTAALTPGAVVLQLASVTSEAAAGREWTRLQKAHPELLGGLDLSLHSAQVKGTTYYRVQTGPFASRAAAADLCARLKSRNQDCLVTTR